LQHLAPAFKPADRRYHRAGRVGLGMRGGGDITRQRVEYLAKAGVCQHDAQLTAALPAAEFHL
jgi:hypothetical protein